MLGDLMTCSKTCINELQKTASTEGDLTSEIHLSILILELLHSIILT